MKVKIVNKKSGYWVGFGDLNQKQIDEIKKLKLSDGTYQIKGLDSCVGIWTDNEGKIWTERSRWFADFTIAYQQGKIRKELAIWDCKNNWNVWLVEQKSKKLFLHVKYKQYEYWIYED